MSNRIPFPKNYERFIQLGKEATNSNDLKKAIDYFRKAYEIRPEFSLNLLLANTYLDVGENDQALFLAMDKKEEYLSCIEFTEMFIQILIQNQKFIDAHCVINERILLEQTGELKQLILLKKKVRDTERMYQQFEMRKIKLLEDELADLANHNYYEQLSIVKKAGKLPQEEFVAIGKKIVLNEQIHNLVRSWVLEEFAKLHIKEPIDFIWRDAERYQVIPVTVGNSLDCGAYQRILLFLEKELVNNNPILLSDVLEEIKLHFSLLYPLADKVIVNPNLWAVSYLITYDSELTSKYQTEKNKEELLAIQKVQEEIRDELSLLI
ncbi:tetratricopeptide repeat protein [Enterococcus sp. LJL99]